MHYKARKHPDSQAEMLSTLLRLASARKLYSGLMASILLSALLALFLPSAGARRTAENATFAFMGAAALSVATEQKTGELRALAIKSKALADDLGRKLADRELVSQQQEIDLQGRETHLKTLESTYKQRCDNAATQRIQREVEAQKRRIETDARNKIREAESKLKTANRQAVAAESKLKKAIAQHEKALADANAFYQSQSDKTILEKQIELDNARGEADAARAAAEKACADAQHVRAEFGEHQDHLEVVKADLQRRVLLAADAAGQAVASEYEKENSKVDVKVLGLAESLRRESLERSALKEENLRLQAPKHCPIDSVQGRRANHIQSFIHGLKDGNGNNHGYRMHWMNIAELGANDIYSYQTCTAFTGTAEDMAKHVHLLRIALRCDGLPKVRHNNKTGFIEFVIPQGHVEPVSEKDICRLLKSADVFVRNSASWQRSRITGGSESGKSPTSELLAYSMVGQLDADLYFHNPVTNSLKAHMTLPQVSSGDEECLAALLQLGADLEAMSNGTKSRPDRFQFHIFDEVDTLITGSTEAINAIELIIKRGSHYGIGIALLGQSDAVTVFTGMTHSDMNNLVQIAIGENARTFIDKMQGVSADDKKKMEDKRRLISDYCNAKNKALGLIASGRNQDAEAVRYCAVKAPNQPVIFYELPPFGSLNPVPKKADLRTCASTAKVPKIAKPGGRVENAAEISESPTEKDSRNLPASAAKGAQGVRQTAPNMCWFGRSGESAPVLRQLDLKEVGAECPHCGESSKAAKSWRVRKSDSSLEMRCKTEGCVSKGKFRVHIISD